MMRHANPYSGFWVKSSGFWPESVESAPHAESEIWLFLFVFSGLEGAFQNPESSFRILRRILEILFQIKALEQISEFGKLPPKGVGDLPAKRGSVTTYPWANFSGSSLAPRIDPTTATPYRQAPDRRHLPPRQATGKGDPSWLSRH
ncbi:hypothetical protein [Mesorhizobium sp. Root552]|uniref:hypothetical protein n=1 Tax=Mesorhizobium sp. Root552 TaxID=1736555 RepID=UPI000A781EB5|nr:hypothetical protein [Mesorhizobium sp. Root552]